MYWEQNKWPFFEKWPHVNLTHFCENALSADIDFDGKRYEIMLIGY
jgi:hypothetical protein